MKLLVFKKGEQKIPSWYTIQNKALKCPVLAFFIFSWCRIVSIYFPSIFELYNCFDFTNRFFFHLIKILRFHEEITLNMYLYIVESESAG